MIRSANPPADFPKSAGSLLPALFVEKAPFQRIVVALRDSLA
jgi:hypothetical protein